MGISIDNVVDKSNLKHLICSICMDLLDNVVTIKTCQHLFCKLCIHNWISVKTLEKTEKSCPDCRIPFTYWDVEVSRIASNMLSDIQFKCDNKDCEVLIQYSEFYTHVNECTKATFRCDFCCITVYKSQQEMHQVWVNSYQAA